MDELFSAIQFGDIEELKQIIDKSPELLMQKNAANVSPLMFAIYCRQAKIIKLLTDKIEPDLYEATALGHTEDVIKMVGKSTTNLNKPSDDGYSLLGLACFFDHQKLAAYFIDHGANVNQPSQNAMKVCPIHSASAAGATEIVRQLISHHADVNAVQSSGTTALHSAIHKQNAELVKMLLSAGANVKIKMGDGTPTLVLAEETGSEEIIMLIEDAC